MGFYIPPVAADAEAQGNVSSSEPVSGPRSYQCVTSSGKESEGLRGKDTQIKKDTGDPRVLRVPEY